MNKKFKLGVEILFSKRKDLIQGKNIGLLTNPTGVDSTLKSTIDLFHEEADVNLSAMYSPEHGVRGDAQAGETVGNYTDERTGVKVYSLYGKEKKPSKEMLKGIDILIFDIQDVGVRFYTYIYTLSYAMEAAKENNIELIVLDRPNPLRNTLIDGPVLEENYASFVGRYPIPITHSMTIGELAYYFNEEFNIHCQLTVVHMENWKRNMSYEETGLEFILSSPNLPTLDSIQIYPGTGLFEGTNVSEGRGTTKPFEFIGAPFIDSLEYADKLNSLNIKGVKFRAHSFQPSLSKYSGELIHGVQIHVIDEYIYNPIEVGIQMIIELQELYPNDFNFLYDSQRKTYFFDELIGNSWVRKSILSGKSYEEIELIWTEDLENFKNNRQKYLIYTN